MNGARLRQPCSALFKPDVDWHHNAYLTRAQSSWYLRADGYRRAAESLVQSCKTFYDRNTLIYSVGFLYRHYIELALKDIIINGNKVVVRPHPIPKIRHPLDSLWFICRSIITERSLASVGEVRSMERYILEFSQFDANSEGFRFPETKDGQLSLPSHADAVSLRGLAKAMEELAQLLRRVAGTLDADVEFQREYEHEMYGGY